MASTSLFAPQMSTAQNAFIYPGEGKVNIYFSLSAYNNIDEVKYIYFSLTDPNVNSTIGSATKINIDNFPLGFIAIAKADIKVNEDMQISKHRYYFSIQWGEDYFDLLTLNQYYQIQLYLIGSDAKEIDITEKIGNYYPIKEDYLNSNKDFISEPSQVSLIRPISAIEEIIFEPSFASSLETVENSFLTSEFLSNLKATIKYVSNDTMEGIVSYRVKIYKSDGQLVYDTGVKNNNTGVHIFASIDYFLEDNDYYFILEYTTIHGYSAASGKQYFKIAVEIEETETWEFEKIEIKNNSGDGSIQIIFEEKENGPLVTTAGTLKILRADDNYNFQNWKIIAEIENLPEFTANWEYHDFLIESGVTYKYRFLYLPEDESKPSYTSTSTGKEEYVITADLEHIFLSDVNGQYSIKYNPVISNYKYVVQENIANTLGGRYPIVQKNAETKYRQFSLSGTIAIDTNIISKVSYDSTGANMSDYWLKPDSSPFLLGKEKIPMYLNDAHGNTAKLKHIYQLKFKNNIVDFLTSNSIKLFRSPTEGNIIVYLSAISFAPNRTLGREVYDFSATATEICAVTDANLLKLNLALPANNQSLYNITKINKNIRHAAQYFDIIPYINYNYIEENSKDLYKLEIV